MNNAALVGVMHGLCELFNDLGSRFRRLRLASQRLIKASTSDVLQHAVGPAVVLTDLEDLHDVRMRQAGRGLDLRAETAAFDTVRAPGAEHFHSDQPLERDLSRQIHNAHPTATQTTQNFESRQLRNKLDIFSFNAPGWVAGR